MDIIATDRGGEKLCLDGFMYENKSKTETTWRYARRVAGSCHTILKTTNYEVYTLAKPHNHPSDKTAVEIEKCRQIMKQQANTTNDQTYPHRTSNQTKKLCKEGYKEENPLQIFYVELASTLEVANHISNIFVRYDHLCICSQFILIYK